MTIRQSCLIGLVAAAFMPVDASSHDAACGTPIAETRGLVESDLATGNLDARVGRRFRADLDRAAAVCAAGRGGEALRVLASAKTRHGYR